MTYKDTLNLPKTDFPMKAGLTTREPEMLARWEESGLYEQIQEARKDAPLFVLHDGPPFANGDVHMGTALNKVLKDFIIKSRTMLGFRAPYIPGWDCHGLPIEFKVVKESRGLSPVEIRERSEACAREFIGVQKRQFRRLGVLGDWENPYLTLDPGYEAEILRSFGRFVEKGLVYQSQKPVLWSTGAQTALAEAEVEYAPRTDPAIFVKFSLRETALPAGLQDRVPSGAGFVIWTTTPWTLPANVAIALDARAEYVVGDFGDQVLIMARDRVEAFTAETGLALTKEYGGVRGEELRGLEVPHPFLPRTSRVITADFVTMDSGTGQVHIAPGHGKDDYVAGQQNGLPTLSPVDEHGKLTEECGMPEWVGKYVLKANHEIVEFLREKNVLLGAKDYIHDYPHCWRSKTPVIFRAVEQFFINVDALRDEALTAIEATKWLPGWGRNRIAGTVASRPDWCISRQRTWGVPLPVFYDAEGIPVLDPVVIEKVAQLVAVEGTNLWFEKDDVWWAEAVGLPADSTRRLDTLDVWLDSGVSHQAVLRQRPELQFPADVYIEATDQHRGWFQSSLLTSVALNGEAPYRSVITHGFVVDKDGKKISKSAQYKKPTHAEHFVNQYGADILRLWVATVQYTDEVPFGEDVFKQVAERYRGFRNVLRILLANGRNAGSEDAATELAGATTIDRWMLGRLQTVISKCRRAYEDYDFRVVFDTLNHFCAVDLSAIYIDTTKDRLYCDKADSPRRRATQRVMKEAFDTITRLLAPILAFTADEAWSYAGAARSVHLETFPEVDESHHDEVRDAKMEEWLALRSLVYQQAIEPARQSKLLTKPVEASVTLQVPAAQRSGLESAKTELEEFFIISELKLVEGDELVARVEKSSHHGCARCWRFLPDVGAVAGKEDLCVRCAEAVSPL